MARAAVLHDDSAGPSKHRVPAFGYSLFWREALAFALPSLDIVNFVHVAGTNPLLRIFHVVSGQSKR